MRDGVELGPLAEEQAALRRVATLVARGASPRTLFAVVAQQVARVLQVPLVSIVRYEADGTATECASFSEQGELFPVGTRWPLDGTNVVVQVRESGRPARIDDYSGLRGTIAETARHAGIRCTVGIPIVVARRLWGAMVVSAAGPEAATGSTDEQLPDHIEDRLADFTALVATAISNSQAREDLRRLADEQAALRRVAMLVAEGAAPAEVFAAVAREVALLLGLPEGGMLRYEADGTATVVGSRGQEALQPGTNWALDGTALASVVLRTGRAARVEDCEDGAGTLGEATAGAGVRSAVGAPIVVDGKLWGVVGAGAHRRVALPPDAERRLSQFAALVAAAISNTQAREDLRRLADEQAALRRVATLVAEGAAPAEVFAAVAREVGLVLKQPLVAMLRYEPDGTATGVGAVGEHPFQPGTNWPLDGSSMTGVVRRTGRPTRVEDYGDVTGTIGEASRRAGFQVGVAAPIVVDGELWGVVCAGVDQRVPVPADAERRLSQFTALVAAAISNTQAREDLRRLADEQAALRRVATLVAEGATPAEVFAAGSREVGLVLKLPLVAMYRYEPDGTATAVGAVGEHPFQPGTNWPLDGPTGASLVRKTGRPARVDDYADVPGTLGQTAARAGITSGVSAPLVVDGDVWGVVAACTDRPEPLPAEAERRLSQFTALVATAISNTQAREDLRRLADEQGALRRLATLVALGADSPVVFDAVCEETGGVLGASSVILARFTSDGGSLTMARWSVHDVHGPAGMRAGSDGNGVTTLVRDTAAPGRLESHGAASGELVDLPRRPGIRSEAGAPVVVEGRVWGALIAASDGPDPLAASAEHRLANFAELIATAVSNAAVRSELMASRVRIVEAADEQRRRVVRDLHDGAQQRLVNAVIALERVPPDVRPLVEEGLRHAHAAINELRELARGIHPAVLTHGGLAAAIQGLADRAPLPVEIEIEDERYPTAVESGAYFVAAEALTNVAKHAHAATARITVTRTPAGLRLVVEDDGVGGGAGGAPGGGLSGLGDRLAALGGRLTIDSPPGGGTRICAEIPLPASA